MTDDENPRIRVSSEWIPAHQAWSKFETASNAAETIERFNQRWPELASDATRTIVPKVRKQLKAIELMMPKRKPILPDLGEKATELLAVLGPEQTIEAIKDEYGHELDLQALVTIAGMPAYTTSLRNELLELRRNKITSQQTATLWNELGRPAAGGGQWTANKVDDLFV